MAKRTLVCSPVSACVLYRAVSRLASYGAGPSRLGHGTIRVTALPCVCRQDSYDARPPDGRWDAVHVGGYTSRHDRGLSRSEWTGERRGQVEVFFGEDNRDSPPHLAVSHPWPPPLVFQSVRLVCWWAQLYQRIAETSCEVTILVRASVLEVYNENIRDLLAPSAKTWERHEIGERNGLSDVRVLSVGAVEYLIPNQVRFRRLLNSISTTHAGSMALNIGST